MAPLLFCCAIIALNQIFQSWFGALLSEIVKRISGRTELFDNSHLLLHQWDLDGKPLNQHQSWFNLGFWETTRQYPQACEALAIRFAEFGQLAGGQNVFDIGFGCGDQLLLWKKHFHVSVIHGQNISESQTEMAKEKTIGLENLIIKNADLDSLADWPAQFYDRVLALDCAYHFDKKLNFFCEANRMLRTSGKIVLADILLHKEAKNFLWKKFLIWAIAKSSSIPIENLVTIEEYTVQLEKAGFQHVQYQFIDRQVFMGYANFIKIYHYQNQGKAHPHRWLKFTGVGRILETAVKKKLFHFSLISASK